MITSSIKVLLWGQEIGRLSWDRRRNISYFEYSKEFLQGPIDAFPLIASVKMPTSRRPIMGEKENKLYHKLPPFLADSLPDAWGNQVFECWRKENGIKNQDVTPLDLLSFIGKRGMGALEYVPETSGIHKSEVLQLQALTDLAGRIFTERENVRILPKDTITMQSLIAVGTSAGGRQPKAIIAINKDTGEIRSGQIADLDGYDYYILKFGDTERSSAELEMAYYDMVITAGIEMMPSRLIEVEGKKHFITMRFDRFMDKKIHMQTLAALYPEAESYEQLLMVCRKMRLPESAQEEVFRRMVFNILANNTDDHNKNFSFLMDDKGRWRLAPAYDLTYIFNMGGYLPEPMHCMLMGGKFKGHTKDDALALAKENGIRKAETIIQQVAEAIAQFKTFASKYGVKDRWANAVETTLNEHLASWGFKKDEPKNPTLELKGKIYQDIRLEQAYKGNFHLIAITDGKERKFVIGKNKPEYSKIQFVGINHLKVEDIFALVKKYLADKE